MDYGLSEDIIRMDSLEENKKQFETEVTNEIEQKKQIKKWTEIFENIDWGIVTGHADGITFDLINPAFAKMHGYTMEELKGMQILDVFAPEVRADTVVQIQKIHQYGHHTFESVHVRKDGTRFPVLVDAAAIKDANGKVDYRVVSVKDISDRIALENKLREERALFMTTLHSLGDAVISTDRCGIIMIMNSMAEKLTGWTEQEAVGRNIDDIFHVFSEYTGEREPSPVKQVLHTQNVVRGGGQIIIKTKDGIEIPIEDSVAPVKDEQGEITGVVIVFRDSTEKRGRIKRIEYLSFHDQLTGLYNRRYFDQEIKCLDVEENLPLSIMMIDVNGLKLTNDAFGHFMGDQLLVSVANAIQRACRRSDVISRIGGDEFVVLLPRTTHDNANKLCERIYTEIEKQLLENIVISVSIGCTTKNAPDEDVHMVLKKAEEIMYHRKLTESKSMRSDTVKIIMKTLSEANERERIHSEQVSNIAKRIAKALSLDKDEIEDAEVAGLLHDIGKIAINKSLLDKPGVLNETELCEVRRHLDVGYQILKSVSEYSNLAEYILNHHERWDGRGYFRGISGEMIPQISRIIAIADSYEAMTAMRPYRDPINREMACKELKRCSGTQFDPRIIRICEEGGWSMFL